MCVLWGLRDVSDIGMSFRFYVEFLWILKDVVS